MKVKKTRFVFLNEYIAGSSPTGLLAKEAIEIIEDKFETKVCHLPTFFKYTPGGFKPTRLVSFALMPIFVPCYLIFIFFLCWIKGESPLVISMTSPPGLHLLTLLVCALFKVPCVVWYQDAHPEIEARWLENKRFVWIANTLRFFEKNVFNFASAIIALDRSMAELLIQKNINFKDKITVIPPWRTFYGNGLEMKDLILNNEIKELHILYAGNFGKAHDLEPFIVRLNHLNSNLQNIIHFTFVGMGDDIQQNIRKKFAHLSIHLHFKKRLDDMNELLELMKNMDLGMVSQSKPSLGLVCPSKSFTYLSQGLPLLYSGPEHTLTGELCKEGWGVTASELLDELEKMSNGVPKALIKKAGFVYPCPRHHGHNEFINLLSKILAESLEVETVYQKEIVED